MSSHVERTPDAKSHAPASAPSKQLKSNENALKFEDNRPEGVRQMKMQEMADGYVNQTGASISKIPVGNIVQRIKNGKGEEYTPDGAIQLYDPKGDILNADQKEILHWRWNEGKALVLDDSGVKEFVSKHLDYSDVKIDSNQKINTAFFTAKGIPEDKAKQMFRTYRSEQFPSRFKNVQQVLEAAGSSEEKRELKETQRHEPISEELNVRGVKQENLKKGIGDGFLAGIPGAWHVHYDHVKYKNNDRIDFKGRALQTVLDDMEKELRRGMSDDGYDTCVKYIENHTAKLNIKG